MKEFRSLCVFASLYGVAFPFCAICQLNAQTNDWQALQRITPGSAISVKVLNPRGRRECELLAVTASDLTCDVQRGMFNKRLVIPRDEISEVLLEYPEHHHMIPGAIIGGAVGAAIGGLTGSGSGDPEAERAAPALGILIGASLGAGVGRIIHQHGAVVYQR